MSGVRHIPPSSIQHAGDSLPGAAEGHHIIATKNRWSRIALTFQNVSPDVWCELSFDIACHPEESARSAHDFAAVGLAFLMEDGSTIDFAYIPGLSQAQIDPFNTYVAGPDHFSRKGEASQTRKVRCNFLIPAPTRQLQVTIRGWRNTHPFQVIRPVLRQFVQPGGVLPDTDEAPLIPSREEAEATSRVTRTWKALTTEPKWLRYALVPGRSLLVRGEIVARTSGTDGALARVIFRDAAGEDLPLPYPETLMAPVLGAFINIPAHLQARRFTLELVPPPGATTVEIGFQSWRNEAPVELVMPLEVSLEVGLLVKNIVEDDFPDAKIFLERTLSKLGAHTLSAGLEELMDRRALAERPSIHARLKEVRLGKTSTVSDGRLQLGNFEPWPLPEVLSWTEDPYRSPLWRQELHTLSWLLDIAGDAKAGGPNRALALALSWSRANPWGQPSDDLNVHPICLAIRTEALVDLLAIGALLEREADAAALFELTGEVVRHCFALAEILGQNVLSHSIYQLHASASLLVAAKALRRIPLSEHWVSLALASLEQGFRELITADGIPFEQSPHQQLEIVSLGLILIHALKDASDADAFRNDLIPRLRNALLATITLTDPGGSLPLIGEAPPGHHYASWIRRLVSQYGRIWLNDTDIGAELSYPQGSRIIVLSNQKIIAARHYERGKDWGYFCASLCEQRHGQGHYDTTSFQFASGGLPWIIDPGGAAPHETSSTRKYLFSPKAHSIAIPDEREPGAGTSWLQSQATLNGGISVFEIRSNAYGPDYIHRRMFVTTDDLSAMAAIDEFEGKTASKFEGLLHFDSKVAIALTQPHSAIAFRGRKQLRIIPKAIVGTLCGLEIVQGVIDRNLPIQGFVSHPAGGLEVANVLRYRIVGHARLCGGVILATSQAGLKRIAHALDGRHLKQLLRIDQDHRPT